MGVELTRIGAVAVVTIDAPPLNLYTGELHERFMDALDEIDRHPPRAVLVRSAGKVVSGGVDVSLFAAQATPQDAKALFDAMLQLPQRIVDLDCPTVFAAHGLTLTWAFEVALACDILLAAEHARFGLVENVIGLTPTMGGTQRLAARAGVGRAKEFVLTGDKYDAHTLERWNVVNQVLPEQGFADAALSYATLLAEGPSRAHRATKHVLRHFEHGGVEEADANVTTIAAALFDTEDLRGGIRSFLADGPGRATFTGR
ncbi:enoyl-CoA hydratase/isomerase family protein [Actinokineospora sp. NBRC 105648]|uniref:enoyl-CoA hydratase/isomerase family protein n=1 Tax=Actinokineospora sp. NBRC 105648 TaxID=3032206 RepID=UPI0024A20D63|nr:enoyl-CoA hydratase/isomerase family protein [Actinokineospora sp. NBRC 105648]GLZ37341.1 enoyl-CoA hydratase [Actinokineospora sp. NBRC 105648]